MNILITIVGICLVWSLGGFLSSRVEYAEYMVVESRSQYEIRLYPARIVAQTVVQGSYTQALNQGFRIVAGYIFGGNTKKERIAMTAPVTEERAQSETIAMTAPVLATMEGDTHTIAFGMPRTYTLETLPMPTDTRVKIVTVPEKKMAVVRFAFGRSVDRVQSKKQALLDALKKDGVTVVGEPQYAGYNSPWTPPWMTRNEVLVEIQ